MSPEEFRIAIKALVPDFEFKFKTEFDTYEIHLRQKDTYWPHLRFSYGAVMMNLVRLWNIMTGETGDYNFEQELTHALHLLSIGVDLVNIPPDYPAIRWFASVFNYPNLFEESFNQFDWFREYAHSVMIAKPLSPIRAYSPLNVAEGGDVPNREKTKLPHGENISIIVFMGQGRPYNRPKVVYCASAPRIVWRLLGIQITGLSGNTLDRYAYNAYRCLFDRSPETDEWFKENFPKEPVPVLIWEPLNFGKVYEAHVFPKFIHTV